jgi:GDPmannose 4,6-dehydratase
MKTALIFGISGQDGSYLAKLLLKKNYKVYGVSRDLEASNLSNLYELNIFKDVEIFSATTSDLNSVMQALTKSNPDEIYNLSGQSSVSLSFDQPIETIESIIVGTQNLLDSIRLFNSKIKFYNACSTECFGNTGNNRATEKSTFHPTSPYAIAKATSFWQVANYREAYGIFACSGILSNHESPIRPERFVTQKIISAACRISKGSKEILSLGNLEIFRDWGWAEEYVEGMWLMLQEIDPDDFIIATGETNSLKSFVERVFLNLDLDFNEHIKINHENFRPLDSKTSLVSPKKAEDILGWKAKTSFDLLIPKLIANKLNKV